MITKYITRIAIGVALTGAVGGGGYYFYKGTTYTTCTCEPINIGGTLWCPPACRR